MTAHAGGIRATCPLCAKSVKTFVWHGRRIFDGHSLAARSGVADLCDATGWLVEDDEIIARPRKTRSDAGRARPSRPSPSTGETEAP